MPGDRVQVLLFGPGSALRKIEQQRRVVAETVTPKPVPATPRVRRVLHLGQQRRVDERVVDAKPMAAVRRIPRVRARLGAQVTKGVVPSTAREAVDPPLFERVEGG